MAGNPKHPACSALHKGMSLLVIAVLLIAEMGMVIHSHQCHGRNVQTVFYSQYGFKLHTGCACGAKAGFPGKPSAHRPVAFEKSSCCSNRTIGKWMNFSFVKTPDILLIVLLPVVLADTANLLSDFYSRPFRENTHAPPLMGCAGRQLLTRIHQLKVFACL